MRYALPGVAASPRIMLAAACTIALLYATGAAIYPHIRLKTDPTFEQELYDQYKGCLETGNGPVGCTSFVKTMREIHSARDNATSSCEAARAAALESCTAEWENNWYDTGAENYPYATHLKDLPRCERIGKAAFDACRHF